MTKKRGSGEGSVFRRKDGLWAATITVGHSPEGKRIRKTVYGPTKGDVTTQLSRLQVQKLDGYLLARQRMTVAGLAERWLTSWTSGLRELSVSRYRECVNRFIIPALGTVDVTKLRPAHVRGLLDDLDARKIGARQRLYVFQTVRRMLNIAVKLELVARNVCSSVDSPKLKRRQIAALTPDQADGVLQAVQGTRWEALFLLALSTGMRMGELFALAWEDLDLDRGVLNLRHSLEEVQGRLTIKEPKSDSGRRAIRLAPQDVEALRKHRKRLADEGLAFQPFVFVDSLGGFLRQSNFRRMVWDKVRAAAGIEGVRFHDLRHSSASFMLRAGIHPKIVQERLGHSTIKLTMDTYSHLLPDSQNEAAGAFHRSRGDSKNADGCSVAVVGLKRQPTPAADAS